MTPIKSKHKDNLQKDESSHSSRIVPSDSLAKSVSLRDIVIILVVAWMARLTFMLIIPSEARSVDAFSWETTAKILEFGGNPYRATTLLNWPPLWMQLIFCLSKIALVLGVPFFRVLQVFLVLVESGVVILLVQLIQEVEPAARLRKIGIIGLALNPIAILLVCQHCNFDVVVAFWLILFMKCLLRYNRTDNLGDWLSACLFLGLGILTKTTPLVLIPMLAGGCRQATALFRFLGSVLLLGPVTLGMSILYVLAPADITSKVLLYHSQTGIFGISGLLQITGLDKYVVVSSLLFYVSLLMVMILSWNLFWQRHSIGSRETVLYAALLLAAIPSLGPGYATQYIYWFLPFLVVTYVFYPGAWRTVLVGFAVISVCTYLVEYAVYPEYGYNLVCLLAKAKVVAQGHLLPPVIEKWRTQTGHVLLNLPIFIAYLILLAFGSRIFFRNVSGLCSRKVLMGYCSLVTVALLGSVLEINHIYCDSYLIETLKSKAEKGNAQAQFQLAKHYFTGEGVAANPTNAFQWLSKAAEQGLAEAQCQLGVCYVQGEGTAKDLDASVPWFRKAAAQDNISAQYNLGSLYENGLGVKLDLTEAAIWYQRAAKKGHILARNNLGLICINSRKDYAEGARWFLLAAAEGYAPAQNNLGVLYSKGLGVKQNANEALEWFEQSAERGFAEGQNNCGLALFAMQRFNESARWFHKAADQGLAAAQYNLAEMYQKGVVYPQDLEEACRWYSRAANQGYGLAQFALGEIYYEGQSVKMNPIEAYKFFRLAQLQGVPDAGKALAICATTMSQEQISAAENEVKQFQNQK